ncbi:MAG: kinase/pyrophosphorylase [Flavobacteriaceae bacterium]|nr:kinase/pyrophosphorylase [Bacteroidia bacterium]NNL15218.1 kinase/pyrophosphorylase [Flavobacteriaceae bacterium]
MLQHIFVISDGTGETAKHSLRSALVQFEVIDVQTHIRSNIRSEEQIKEIIEEAHLVSGLIVHTMVAKKLRHLILEQGRLHELRTIDLMGPLLAQLSNHFENLPTERPGIYQKLSRSYFQRIEAIEYTLRHDDGQHVEELGGADIVLLGVSRTFKTPLSVYMAYRGWRVANVPIVLNIPVPDIVLKLPPERVFCLTTISGRLAELRKARDKYLGGLTGHYSSRSHVHEELNYASKIFRTHPKWTVIRVTNKPIEEICSEILANIRRRKNKP